MGDTTMDSGNPDSDDLKTMEHSIDEGPNLITKPFPQQLDIQFTLDPKLSSELSNESEFTFNPIPEQQEERSPLLLEGEEKKVSFGEFRTISLSDIDGSLQLPGDELEKFSKRSPVRVEEPDSSAAERGRLRIHNVGGSLTFLLQIALLAWGVRQLRSVLAKRRQKQAPRINTVPFRPVDPPLFTTMSAAALRKLVETNPTPYLLIDVRFPEAVEASPFLMKNTINIPEAEIRTCFQLSEADWEKRFPFLGSPTRIQLLVFLSTKGRRAQRAAASAAELGYNGCGVLSGGILGFQVACQSPEQYQPEFLSRDSVATLLQGRHESQAGNRPSLPLHLIDVRRHDERALYGHFYGSSHVPVSEWPKALAMEASDWERNYHCQKPGKDDLIILYCRTNNRSFWAAQVAHDAGLTRCYVCKGGVLGWRLDTTVLPYDGYALGDLPPEPIKFEVETIDQEAAEKELQELGLRGISNS